MQELDRNGGLGDGLNQRCRQLTLAFAEDWALAQAAAAGDEFAKARIAGAASLLRSRRPRCVWWEDAIGDWVKRFLRNPSIVRGYSGEVSLQRYLFCAINYQRRSLRRSDARHHNLEKLRANRPDAFQNQRHGVLNARRSQAAGAQRLVCEHFNRNFFERDGPGRPVGLVAAARAGLFEELRCQIADVRDALALGTHAYSELIHLAEALLELLGWIALGVSRKSGSSKRFLSDRLAAARAEANALETALRAA